MPRPHKWQHRFQGHGARWTVPRRAILDLLSRTSEHMSAKEAYTALHKMYPGIGLTTVYRTLDLLVRMGLLHKFAFGTGESRYEFRSDTEGTHHHHLICTDCGKIVDYKDFVEEELELIKKTEAALATKYNYCITDHNIEFYGLCAKCKS